jgi:hypothetical protein
LRRLAVISVLCFLVTATVAWGEVLPAMSSSAPTSSPTHHLTPQPRQAKASGRTHLTLLFGRKRIGPGVRAKRAGSADAFRFTEKTAGAARAISVYVTTPSTSKTLVAGLYSDRGGEPSTLLAAGSTSVPKSGRWVTVAVARTSLVQGRVYWIAVLGPSGHRTSDRPERSAPSLGPRRRARGLHLGLREWLADHPRASRGHELG